MLCRSTCHGTCTTWRHLRIQQYSAAKIPDWSYGGSQVVQDLDPRSHDPCLRVPPFPEGSRQPPPRPPLHLRLRLHRQLLAEASASLPQA